MIYQQPTIYNAPTVYKMGGGGGPTPPQNVVHIGNSDYHYVQIGDLLWIDENLHEQFTIGTDEGDMTYGRAGWQRVNIGGSFPEQTACGRMYNNLALDDIQNNLPTGWRIPLKNDFNDLYSSVNNDIFKLLDKVSNVYKNFSTNNESGFSLKFFGSRNGGTSTYTNSVFVDNIHLWCKYESFNSTPYVSFALNGSYPNGLYSNTSSADYTKMKFVRICKDA